MNLKQQTMSLTKRNLDENTGNPDAQYDADYLDYLREQDLQRRMAEESVMQIDCTLLSEILGSMPNEIPDEY